MILIFIIRPISVIISTYSSGLTWKEKAFISWMAPRGIVAAAVSSIFALRLAEVGIPQSEIIVPNTFLIIIGTVAFYGFTAPILAKKLNISQAEPQGVAFVGAHNLGISLAKILIENGFKSVVIDTNRISINRAKMNNIPVHHGSVLARDIFDKINFNGIGKLIALTPNDEANALAVLHFSEFFERQELYQINPEKHESNETDRFSPQHLRGRFIFESSTSFNSIYRLYSRGWKIKYFTLSDGFTIEMLKEKYKSFFIPMFLIAEDKKLKVFTTDTILEPKSGSSIICLVNEE